MRRAKSFRVALPAILAAVSLALLYLAALLPAGRWAMAAVAGLLPAAAVISTGLWGGFATWGVTGLLGLLLVPDRLIALLYLLFFGLYPMVKSLLERTGRRWPALAGKLIFFLAALSLFLFAFARLFVPALPWNMGERLYLVYLLGCAVFLVYDFGFTKLIGFYMARVGKAVRP